MPPAAADKMAPDDLAGEKPLQQMQDSSSLVDDPEDAGVPTGDDGHHDAQPDAPEDLGRRKDEAATTAAPPASEAAHSQVTDSEPGTTGGDCSLLDQASQSELAEYLRRKEWSNLSALCAGLTIALLLAALVASHTG